MMECPYTVLLHGRDVYCTNPDPEPHTHRLIVPGVADPVGVPGPSTMTALTPSPVAAPTGSGAPDNPPVGVPTPPGSDFPAVAEPGGNQLERVLERVRASIHRQLTED